MPQTSLLRLRLSRPGVSRIRKIVVSDFRHFPSPLPKGGNYELVLLGINPIRNYLKIDLPRGNDFTLKHLSQFFPQEGQGWPESQANRWLSIPSGKFRMNFGILWNQCCWRIARPMRVLGAIGSTGGER